MISCAAIRPNGPRRPVQRLLPFLLLIEVVTGPAAAAACADPVDIVAALEQATMEGRFDVADRASDALVASFGCGGPADKELVARLWLSRAVLAAARGDDAAATDALAAAKRVSPTTWNEMYGPTLRERWEQSASLPAGAVGSLRLDSLPDGAPHPDGAHSAIDGERVSLPAEVPSGLHLLQVGPSPRNFTGAQVFYLPPGLELVLDPGLLAGERHPGSIDGLAPPATRPPPVRRPPPPRTRRLIQAAVVGGAAAALYGVTFATNGAFYGQPEGGGARTAARQRVNNGLVVGSAGIGVVSGVLLIRGLATPGIHANGRTP
jgi:hypothetical protein